MIDAFFAMTAYLDVSVEDMMSFIEEGMYEGRLVTFSRLSILLLLFISFHFFKDVFVFGYCYFIADCVGSCSGLSCQSIGVRMCSFQQRLERLECSMREPLCSRHALPFLPL